MFVWFFYVLCDLLCQDGGIFPILHNVNSIFIAAKTLLIVQ